MKSNKWIILPAVMLFSAGIGMMYLRLIEKAYTYSSLAPLRIFIYFMIVTAFLIGIALKSREYFLYAACLAFPFLSLAFGGIPILRILTAVLVVLYWPDILAVFKERRHLFGWPFAVFLLCFFYTTILARHPMAAMNRVLFFLTNAAFYFVLTAYMRTGREMAGILKCLMVVLAFCVGVSVWQSIFGIESIQFFFGGYNENTAIDLYTRRIPSVFSEAQEAGQYFAILTILALGCFFFFKRRKLFVFLALASAGAMMLTISRMAIGSFFVGLTIILCVPLNARKLLSIVLLAGILSAVSFWPVEQLLPESFATRFNRQERMENFRYRYGIWEQSLPISQQYPFGVGLDGTNRYDAALETGADVIPIFHRKPKMRPFTHFENSYLDLLYSLGIFGVLGFILLLAQYLYHGLTVVRKKGTSPDGHFAIFLIAGVCVWALSALTSPLLFRNHPVFLLMILLAMMNALYFSPREDKGGI